MASPDPPPSTALDGLLSKLSRLQTPSRSPQPPAPASARSGVSAAGVAHDGEFMLSLLQGNSFSSSGGVSGRVHEFVEPARSVRFGQGLEVTPLRSNQREDDFEDSPSDGFSFPSTLSDGSMLGRGIRGLTSSLLRRDSFEPMSPAFENAVDELPVSSPIYPPGKETLAKTLGESYGRVGFGLFLYEDESSTPVCGGLVGSSREKFCTVPAGECSVVSHAHRKGALAPATLYVEIKKGSVALFTPALSAALAKKSGIFQLHCEGCYPIETWKALFDCVEVNAVATDPARGLVTEDDSKRLLENSIGMSNPTPKRIRLVTSRSASKQAEGDITLQDFARETTTALKAAEQELTRIHTSLTVVASLTGRPKRAVNAGSAWGAIEAIDDRHNVVDSTLAAMDAHQRASADNVKGAVERLQVDVSSAVAQAASANTNAAHVRGLVSMLESTGALGAIGMLERRLKQTETQNAQLKGDLSALISAMETIVDSVTASSNTEGLEPRGTTALMDKIGSLETLWAEQFKDLRSQVGGTGTIQFGQWRFDGVDSCKALLLREGLTFFVYEFPLDIAHLLAKIVSPTRSRSEVQDDTVLESKTGVNSNRMAAIASTQIQVPEALAGSASSRSDLTHWFGALKDANMWDAGDGIRGTKNEILRGIATIGEVHRSQLVARFQDEHPEFFRFCDLCLSESVQEFKDFAEELSSFNQNLLSMSYGPNPTVAQQKEVWPLALTFPMVYWEEIAKARHVASGLHSYDDPTLANAVMMWATIQAHHKHAEFKRYRFREHPRIYPKVFSHLFRRCAHRSSLDAIQDTADAAKALATATRSSNLEMKARLDGLVSTVDNLKRMQPRALPAGGAGGNGGGDNGYGQGRRQRPRNRQGGGGAGGEEEKAGT